MPVRVEEIRGPVERDRGLAGAGTALHHQDPAVVGADDRVLLGLERGNDVVHAAGAPGVERGEQCGLPGQLADRHPVVVENLVVEPDDPAPPVVMWRRLRTPCGAAGVAT